MKQFLGAIAITLCTGIALAQTSGSTGSTGQGTHATGSTSGSGAGSTSSSGTTSGSTASGRPSSGGYSLSGGNVYGDLTSRDTIPGPTSSGALTSDGSSPGGNSSGSTPPGTTSSGNATSSGTSLNGTSPGTSPSAGAANADGAPGAAGSTTSSGISGQDNTGTQPKSKMMQFSERTTPGWSMMTSAERKAYRDKMRGFLAADECRSYNQQHMIEMEERAQARGRTFNPAKADPCATLQ